MASDPTHELHTGDLIEPWSGVSVPASGDDLVGATLNGSYVVERLLGEGGMGRVYLARHARIEQKRVAIKVLHSEFAGRSEVLARFQREAEAAAAVSHPNVVTVLDVDVTARGMPYLVCEYLEGVDLADYLKEVKRLDVVDALSITRQLCRGLAAAHARGVVHRDLKPANVFLVGDFRKGAPPRLFAKILDFGLSRFDASEGSPSLTKTGYIMGTPSYMAPEQARGQRVDQRADVYGLGTVLYTLLTGRTPFDEDTPQATILAVLNAEPPRPRTLVPTIPPHVELIIERAMAKDPAARYPDMTAFERALEALPSAGAVVGEALAPATSEAPLANAKRSEPLRQSDADVHAARPRLLLAILCAVLMLIAAAMMAISGVELATGYAFDQLELRLIMLGIVGTSLTPALLWFLHIRRRVWDNSSRVLQLLSQVRAALITGICSYGLLVMSAHVIDDFLVRFLGRPDVQAVGATWRGWNLLLPAAALVTAISVAWRRRLLATLQPGFRRLAAVWLLTALAVAIVTGIVRFGIVWRAASGG